MKKSNELNNSINSIKNQNTPKQEKKDLRNRSNTLGFSKFHQLKKIATEVNLNKTNKLAEDKKNNINNNKKVKMKSPEKNKEHKIIFLNKELTKNNTPKKTKNNFIENIDTNNNDEKADKFKKKESKKYMLLSSQLKKQMNEMKYYRLCVIDNKDMVGLNDICWDNKKSFITATCISSEAVVFSIKINILDLLMKKNRKLEKNVQEITKKRAKERKKARTKRWKKERANN